MNRTRVLTAALGLLAGSALAQEASLRTEPVWDGSRTTPVHNFPMYDETGQQIVPEYNLALPMSTKNTCGTCHTYATVSSGWHFNSSKGNAAPGRPGEPWVLVDQGTGTQLPLSYRAWPGMWNPDAVGITPWEFTKRFARHMPGGDFAEPSENAPVDPKARWEVSGKLQVNCLACHNGSTAQDHSEWALQNSRENFRWAATTAAGLGTAKGMATRMRDSWVVGDGPNPDDNEFAVAPAVDYNKTKFDSKHRTVFDVRRVPPDQNCQQCHSATPVIGTKWVLEQDVHSAAGIHCADCHRNGLDHNIVRGYSTEAKEKNDPHVGEFSCAGCHIGSDKKLPSGRMAAPIPAHKGIPPVHFEKMECTVCHSGPLPTDQLTRMRTSRANRLGIHGRAQWFTESPYIVEPVFVRGKSGKVAPHRMMWPAFWATMEGEKLNPMLPDDVTAAGAGILDMELQIGKVLKALTSDPDAEGTAVLVLKNRVFAQDKDGGLQINDYKGTRTIETSMWGRETSGIVATVVPEFDPYAEMDSADTNRLLRTLEVLEGIGPETKPAILLGNKRYTRTFEGTLETTDTATSVSTMEVVKLVSDKLEPLVATDALLNYAETAGTEFTLNEASVARVLQKLDTATTAGAATVRHAYVSNGRAFKLDGAKLVAFDNDAAKPTSWAIGHDVRPAAQSLGAKSCGECHSSEAAFLFAGVMPTGPLKTASAVSQPMHTFQKLDGDYQKLFGMSFQVRSAFKTAMFVIAGLLSLLLLAFAMVGLRRLTQYVAARN